MSWQPSVESFSGLSGGGVTDEHKSGHEPETVVLSLIPPFSRIKRGP